MRFPSLKLLPAIVLAVFVFLPSGVRAEDGWVLVETKDFSSGSSQTFSGLNGDAEGQYKIVGNFAPSGSGRVAIIFNGDSGNNYKYAGMKSKGGTISGFSATDTNINLHDEDCSNGSDPCSFEATIFADTSDKVNVVFSLLGGWFSGGEHIYYTSGGGRWTSTSNVTSITVLHPLVASASTISLYKQATFSGGSVALNDLTDVTITTPGSGNFLSYNGSGWVNTSALMLDDIVDVNAPSPTDTYALKWNAASGEWQAAADSGGAGASGVDAIIAGAGISVDSATGTVTITATTTPEINLDTDDLENQIELQTFILGWGVVAAVAAVAIAYGWKLRKG